MLSCVFPFRGRLFFALFISIVDHPYNGKNSKVTFLASLDSCKSAFSIDVEDLFYSIFHDALLPAVRCCIEKNGDAAFQNSTGISVDNFMILLEYYLSSTFVASDGEISSEREFVLVRVLPQYFAIFF